VVRFQAFLSLMDKQPAVGTLNHIYMSDNAQKTPALVCRLSKCAKCASAKHRDGLPP
jgi:hypothetical protein